MLTYKEKQNIKWLFADPVDGNQRILLKTTWKNIIPESLRQVIILIFGNFWKVNCLLSYLMNIKYCLFILWSYIIKSSLYFMINLNKILLLRLWKEVNLCSLEFFSLADIEHFPLLCQKFSESIFHQKYI